MQNNMLKLSILLLIVAGSTGCASKMLYYPTRRVYTIPAEHGIRHEEVTFKSKDGTKLSGWFVPAKGKAKGTVIHFHGNAQNMTAHFAFVSWLPAQGFNVFVFDYRGYGKSAGSPNRKGVHMDSCAALDYLRSRDDIDTERILVFGQSLGGATSLAALQGAGSKGVRAVAIDSAFYSYRVIVRDKLKEIPLISLLRWPLSYIIISNAKSPASTIRSLPATPLLLMHGTADAVIPYRHGQMLFERARAPKEMISIPRGRHTDALTRRDPTYRKSLVTFFEDSLAERELTQ